MKIPITNLLLGALALIVMTGIVGTSVAAGTTDNNLSPLDGATFRAGTEPPAGTRWIERHSGVEFVFVPSGCSYIGSNSGDRTQQPAKQVCIRGFWMGRTEVTQAQYQQVVGKNPSYYKGSDRPVENVSFDDSVAFADKLSQHSGTRIRLPSEAEWEYACRAGSHHGSYCGTGDLSTFAWIDLNSHLQTHPVGGRSPNAWGLHDMNGNVWEWTLDCWNPDLQGTPTDGNPQMTGQCERRVMRGGSWNDAPVRLNAAFRDWAFYHRFRFGSFGFRVIRE